MICSQLISLSLTGYYIVLSAISLLLFYCMQTKVTEAKFGLVHLKKKKKKTSVYEKDNLKQLCLWKGEPKQTF